MVKPGASSEEIRKEVFTEFRSNINDGGINDEVTEIILSEITSDDPPDELSETLVENVIEDDGA